MTDAPDRQIAGLRPRAESPDLSRLRARNRVQTEEIEQDVTQAAEPALKVAPADKAAERPRKSNKRATQTTSAPQSTIPEEPVTPMSIYMGNSLKSRARAAYKATRNLEDDKTWSAFVQQAILRETLRRETEYNNGEPYEGDDQPLPPGRPLS